jgi:putative glutamine amidotransferase
LRPLIGMTCGTLVDPNGRRPTKFSINQAYVRAIADAGGTPFLIGPIGDVDVLRGQFAAVHGLLLPGGGDIEPSFYGAAPTAELDGVDVPLDEAELTLARWALSEGKPFFGICRGHQCMNVAAGGTLIQDIPTEVPNALSHRLQERTAMAHGMIVEPDSLLADVIGTAEVDVNSMHHQSVLELAPGMVVCGRSPDGVVEAIERPDHPFALSVQFHPEELVPGHEASERLFRRFIEAAAGGTRMGRR